MVVALAELLALLGSVVLDVTWAELVSELTLLPTATRIVTVALAPLLSVPMAQLTVFVPLHEPCEAVALTKVAPVGSVSVTETLPAAAAGLVVVWAGSSLVAAPFDMPLGPQPQRFVVLMLALGLLASWLGGMCWNEASQRLPTTLAGQLIVFETLAALAYVFALRGALPPAATLAGIALLLAGVLWALRLKPTPPAAAAGAPH